MFALLEQQHSTDFYKEILRNKVYLKYTLDRKKNRGHPSVTQHFLVYPHTHLVQCYPPEITILSALSLPHSARLPESLKSPGQGKYPFSFCLHLKK